MYYFNLITVFIIFFINICFGEVIDNKKLPEKWFTQPLDHCKEEDLRTWKQVF